ncbi:hypothetical protein ACF06X_34295 [Streptomyces sp. NPDC015346]|uniref:hypothetical protein n=1 Tax=Streptomyces sp. NPDC015346 TaxID=3364954 RepID=UPI0036F7B85F
MIPLPPHRMQGPGALGATPEQPDGPFGRWPDPYADEDDEALVPGITLPAARDGSTR